MGEKRKKIWLADPVCLFWTLWCERNRLVFENEVSFAQRTKTTFLSNLWSRANLYSVDKTNSLVDFLSWMGVGRIVGFLLGPVGFLLLFFFFLSPSGFLLYTLSVLLGTSWFFFYQYIAFYRSKK